MTMGQVNWIIGLMDLSGGFSKVNNYLIPSEYYGRICKFPTIMCIFLL